MLRACYFALFFVSLTLAEDSVNPVVATEYGTIEGFNYETPDGFKVEMFLGIPYASPPINELRYEVS